MIYFIVSKTECLNFMCVQPHIQANSLLRDSAPKELSLPHRHPNFMVILMLIL
tara:strand:+ start:241 stop:399 length:159 start_codon:yes stop_codon:yes gene_type:complete